MGISHQAKDPFPRFRAERFVYCVEVGGVRYKLFQVMFSRKDGSLYVSFPYYAHRTGLVSAVTHPAGSSTASLEIGGKITSHLVKYSHHPDGRVHSSQDGKVFTRIRKHSVPLDQIGGHVFSLHVQGLSALQTLDAAERDAPPKLNRTTLSYIYEAEQPTSFKLVGRIYPQESLHIVGTGDPVRPIVVDPALDGQIAFVTAPPLGSSGDDRVLLVDCSSRPTLTEDCETILFFMGGFDPPEVSLDYFRPTTFSGADVPGQRCRRIARSYWHDRSSGVDLPMLPSSGSPITMRAIVRRSADQGAR